MVERWHWFTEGQLLDAIAVGQITPGPIFTTAAFIGHVLDGGTGQPVVSLLAPYAMIDLKGFALTGVPGAPVSISVDSIHGRNLFVSNETLGDRSAGIVAVNGQSGCFEDLHIAEENSSPLGVSRTLRISRWCSSIGLCL